MNHFEKQRVIASIEEWQALRVARNQAAHEYEIDYGAIADHFNALHELLPRTLGIAGRLTVLCNRKLGIGPSDDSFAEDFVAITGKAQAIA